MSTTAGAASLAKLTRAPVLKSVNIDPSIENAWPASAALKNSQPRRTMWNVMSIPPIL